MAWVKIFSVSLILLQCFQGLHATQKNITIKLGFIAPLNSGLGATSELGTELETAFRIAVEIINGKAKGRVRLSTDFQSMVKDGGLNPSTTCKIAAQQLAADPEIVGVVGGLRSSCSIASHQYFRDNADTMTQVSYGSTSPQLSNKKTFPKFFRTCASDVHQASALADLVTYFNWKRVSTITSTDVSAKDLTDRFETQSRLKGVRVVASSRFSSRAQPDTIERKVQLLKDSQTRVNLVSSLPKNAQTVFQKAKAKGMSGQGWVWIGTDGVTATPLSNQTHPDVIKSMQGAIGIAPRAGSGAVFLNVVVHWWTKRHMGNKHPGPIYDTPFRLSYVPQVYDAVNAYYLAFERLEKAGKIAPGDSPQKLRRLVFDELKKFNNPATGFESALGMNTYFDSNFDGPPAYDVVNLKGIDWDRVATWNKSIGIERMQKEIIWPGNTRIPPTDKGLPGKTTFRIGFLAPTLPELGGLAQLGKEFQAALNVAVDMVNKNLLFSVDFDVKVQKVGKDPATDCKVAASRLANDDVVAVIGAYRSDCSAAAAKVFGSSSHRVPQVSFGSTSSRLSDKTKYKYLFRTSSSDANQARALAALFRKYRWPEVGILSTSDTYGGDLADDFKKEVEGMPDVPVNVASRQEFPINGRANVVRPKVDKLKRAGTKVNFISMVRNDAETVFQQIRELGMTGKGWVWLASDGATTSTFDKQKDLQRAMKGMLGVQPKNGAGSLYYKFLAAWMDGSQRIYPGRPNRGPASSVFMPQLIDAVRGVALALSDLVNKKQISRSTNVMTVREKLYQKLKSFDDPSSGYPSATGNNDVMYFDQHLDGPPRYDVVNLQDDNWITVGHYDPKTKDVTITRDPVFPGGTTIPIVGDGRPTYKIAAFFPKHNDLGALAELGREWESAFKVAVSQANADPNFKVAFSYILVDGGPSTETCVKAAKDLPDDIDLIIGEARSTCSIAIAKATRSRKIPQMSYASTSSKLSDKQAYPYFFRTCAADSHQAMALAKLVGRFGWERIGTIATTDDYAEDLARKFALDLRRTGVEITAEERFNMHTKHSVSEEMKDLKSSGAAVNLISSVTDDAEKVFQEAIEQGMTGNKWAWLGTDGSTSSTFINTPNLKHAMQGMVGTRPKAGDGQIYRELLKTWAEKDAILYPGLLHSSRVRETSPYVAQVQDAVLAFANALTRLHEAKTVTKLTPRPTVQRELIGELKKMKDAKTGFQSAIGTKAFFDSNQDGPAEYDLVNLNGNSWIRVGSYTPSKGLSIRRKIVWSGGRLTPPSSKQPKDSTTSSEKVQTSTVSSSGLVAMGAVFGILAVALIGFIVFLIHRERRGKPSFGPNVFRRTNGTVGSPVNNISSAMDGAAAVLNHGVIRSEEKPVPV